MISTLLMKIGIIIIVGGILSICAIPCIYYFSLCTALGIILVYGKIFKRKITKLYKKIENLLDDGGERMARFVFIQAMVILVIGAFITIFGWLLEVGLWLSIIFTVCCLFLYIGFRYTIKEEE